MKIFNILLFCVALNQIQAQDWANLTRYSLENKTLLTSEQTIEAVFFGNSITEGWPQFNPTFFKEHNFIGRGIGGQTTPQLLLRFRQDVLGLRPKKVILLAGINDIAQNTGPINLNAIMDNIISMAELASANDVEMILCSVLPVNSFPWRPEIIPTQMVIELNQKINAYAQKMNLVYVDYYIHMANTEKGLKDYLGYDTVHPNKAGYEVMEKVLLTYLK